MTWNLPSTYQLPIHEETTLVVEETSPKKGKYSKRANKPNPLISKTEKCKVCDEPAAIHIHYGAITCFSCRAFFRRSIQNNSSEVYRCREEGSCDITLKSRKSCQKCRLDKCLRIGMKSNWVLTEEERFHRFRKNRKQSEHHNSNRIQHFDDKEWDQLENQEQMLISATSQLSPSGNEQLEHQDQSQMSKPHYFYTTEMLAMDFTNTLNPSRDTKPLPVNVTLFPRHLEHHEESIEPLNLKVESPQHNRGSSPKLMNLVQQFDPDEFAGRNLALRGHLLAGVTIDEFSQLQIISQIHDTNYKSISFGEELIKEMVMSSVFKVPLSPSATMTAYRLMIQRVTRVAQGLDPFINLPHRIQRFLLKQNADLIVSLRGAVFFEKHKCGLDQILISMGVDDLCAAMQTVSTAMKTMSLKRIDYLTFNTLQKMGTHQTEQRYNELLEHVGITVSFDIDLVKILSYILLFSYNGEEADSEEWKEVQCIHGQMLGMMKRYIRAKYPEQTSDSLFSEVLQCISDLHELTWIKKQRQLASSKDSSSLPLSNPTNLLYSN